MNLSRSEFHTLSRLRSLKGIKILAADENLGPVIVRESWYIREVSRLLSDERFYKKVDVVPFISIKRNLISIIDRLGHSIGDKLKSYIVHNHAPAHFRLLPKVHKCPLVGRLIVASTSYLTTQASRFIHCTLAPLLSSLPSYLKESSDLVRQLNSLSTVPGSYLVTADVTSPYTNIPVKECITTIDLFCRSKGCIDYGTLKVCTDKQLLCSRSPISSAMGVSNGYNYGCVSCCYLYGQSRRAPIVNERACFLQKVH